MWTIIIHSCLLLVISVSGPQARAQQKPTSSRSIAAPDRNQSQGTFLSPPGTPDRRSVPLSKGIADIQTRIQQNKRLAEQLQEAVAEHVLNIGEIIYESYGQKGDPGVELIKLKKAYQDVHSATINGVTEQLGPAIGQLGQAILDCWSDSNVWVNNVNAIQQITWESARLKTTASELAGVNSAIARDVDIEQKLENKSAQMVGRQPTDAGGVEPSDDSVLPKWSSNVDFSAWDDSVLIGRWLDLGNRAFRDKDEENRFYWRFPDFERFRKVADTSAPIVEVQQATTKVKAKQNDNDICAPCRGSNTIVCQVGCPEVAH